MNTGLGTYEKLPKLDHAIRLIGLVPDDLPSDGTR